MDDKEKEQKVIRAAEEISKYCAERACGFCVFLMQNVNIRIAVSTKRQKTGVRDL